MWEFFIGELLVYCSKEIPMGIDFSPTFCWDPAFQNSRLPVTQSQMLMAKDSLPDLQLGCANNLTSILIFARHFWDASTKMQRRGMVELAGSIWILLLARNLFQELTWISFLRRCVAPLEEDVRVCNFTDAWSEPSHWMNYYDLKGVFKGLGLRDTITV